MPSGDRLTPSIGVLADVGVDPLGLVALAREAEEAGFGSMWTIEYEYDSFALNQALLQGTERLEVGSCIARYFARDPLLVVEQTTIVDLLAPGRYHVGIGTGPMKRSGPAMAQQRWGGDPRRSIGRMSEYLELIGSALASEELVFDYEGEFFHVSGVKLRLKPAGRVPIWLAAGGPKMAKVAGRYADGVFVHFIDEEGTKETLAHARQGAEEAGRDPDALMLGNLVPTCVADDREAARRGLRAYLLDYYLHLPHYHRWLREMGYDDTVETILASGVGGDTKRSPDEILADPAAREAAESIPDRLLDEMLVVGTPEECRARVEAIAGWGTDVPILYAFPADGDWARGYRNVIDAFATTRQEVAA
jgi:alkanesulfonate monooxygenase SsuD/methylene tetrahydromethanopterin reductase-like flavin-dependent oxidoreductase (luciferase family)